jgi:agmatinase
MDHFYRSNVYLISEANIILLGVEDESKSLARRKGTSKGPHRIRIASNESEFFEREGRIIPTSPMSGTFDGKKIFDLGNVKKEDLYELILKLATNKKIPIAIGGDHSITTTILRAMGEAFGKVGIVYFDAHPDFVSSTRNYYGSVLTDCTDCLDFKKSLLIGTRSAEYEELENIRQAGLEILTPLDIVRLGIRETAEKISAQTTGKKYISIDLDCLDPAFAPGVSVPSAGGLSSIDLIFLLKKAVSNGIVGMDLVELSPDFDINNATANLGARLISEAIASIRLSEFSD